MPATLVINHHSLSSKNSVSSGFSESCTYLKDFFETWQYALQKEICEKSITCDTDMWSWNLGENKTMYDYILTLKRDAMLFTQQLLKITKKTSLEYFDDEILELATGANSVLLNKQEASLLGCVCLSDGAITLSLVTSELWKNCTIKVNWNTSSKQQLQDTFHNFSLKEHVDEYYNKLLTQEKLTEVRLNELLPTVHISKPFWDWFIDLDRTVQNFIIEKAQFCAAYGWVPRANSPYKPLQGTKNNLTEIRLWPIGKVLRIYTKKESDTKVIFLGGSDKDGQDEAIIKADKYYSANS